MLSLLTKITQNSSKTRQSRAFSIETMEQRELFAADVIGAAGVEPASQAISTAATVEVSRLDASDSVLSWDPTCDYSISDDKVVTIQGGMSGDHVTVSDNYSTGMVTIDIQCGSGQHVPWIFPQGEVQEIIFHGGSGNDVFLNHSLIPSVAYGDLGNDKLVGGGAGDELHGGHGADHLEGNGMGWGMLRGDELYGDQGDDKLIGGGWNDLLVGGSGHDQLFGGGGNDLLHGGTGNDQLWGGAANDQLFGGSGWDQLFGEAGDDYLQGGNDGVADQMTGGLGNDTFVNEWRQKTQNSWVPVEFEQITDLESGDSVEWKQTPVRMWIPLSLPPTFLRG